MAFGVLIFINGPTVKGFLRPTFKMWQSMCTKPSKSAFGNINELHTITNVTQFLKPFSSHLQRFLTHIKTFYP